MIHRVWLSLVAAVLVIAFSARAQDATVPLDHQVYPLLEKGEALGLFSSYDLSVLPLTRAGVGGLLDSMKIHDALLSQADRSLLDQMLGEFKDPPMGEPSPPEAEQHLFRFEEGSAQLFGDARFIQEGQIRRGRRNVRNENISMTTVGGAIRGTIGNHFFLGMSARNTFTSGAANTQEYFNPLKGPIQVATGGGTVTDQATGYVGGSFGPFSFVIGRDYLSWGEVLLDQPALSAQNDPLNMIKAVLAFHSIRFTYFHASLDRISGAPRYLVGHRLDFQLTSRLRVGGYETVVYGRRGPELGYLNPFVVYNIMEHQLGDLDNNTIGLDISGVPVEGVRVFGELFVDDLSPDRSLTTYWGAKLAYGFGVQWAGPLGWKTGEWVCSYMRVDPFVYTHDDSTNVYAYRGRTIGTTIGPNGDRVIAGVRVRPVRDVFGELSAAYERRGQGNIFTPHRPEEGEGKHFLEGIVERSLSLQTAVRVQTWRDIFFAFQAAWTRRWNADLIAGVSAKELVLRAALDVNY